MTQLFRKRGHAMLWVAAFAVSLWLRINIPAIIMGSAYIDDGLFIRLARSISTGHWLDHYDQYILAKGMFYSLFVATTNFLCVPVKAAEQIVYLLTSALTARFIARQAQSRWLGTLLFVCLAFNPFLWMWQLARMVREGLYISLSLGVVALAASMLFSPAIFQKKLLRAATCGVLLGAFWLTREEGVWILPALSVLAAIAFARIMIPASSIGSLHARVFALLQPGICIAVVIACAAAANAIVAEINYRVYGVYETVEFKNRNFVRAYSDLAGIKTDDWRPLVVLPAKARQLAYAASPAALELKPFLDGPLGAAWRGVGCAQSAIPAGQCPDIMAAWFMWAFRDAVAGAGHAGSAGQADAFYARLAGELEAACHDRRLPCAHRSATLAPPFRRRYIGAMFPVMWDFIELLFALPPRMIESLPTDGNTLDERDNFADLTGSSAVPPDSLHHLTGWMAARKTMPMITVAAPGGTVSISNSLLPAPDVGQVYPDLVSTRFNLFFTCPATKCALRVIFPDGTIDLPVGGLSVGRPLDRPDGKLALDLVQTQEALPVTRARQAVAQKIIRAGIWIFRILMPVCALLAIAGYGAAAWRRAIPVGIFAFAASGAAAIATRIVLLGYLQVASIPSLSVLYLSPVSPFALLFVGIGLYAGLMARKIGGASPAPQPPVRMIKKRRRQRQE